MEADPTWLKLEILTFLRTMLTVFRFSAWLLRLPILQLDGLMHSLIVFSLVLNECVTISAVVGTSTFTRLTLNAFTVNLVSLSLVLSLPVTLLCRTLKRG